MLILMCQTTQYNIPVRTSGFTYRPRYRCPSAQHEGLWKSRGVTPLILNLGTRWEWIVSFMPLPAFTHWMWSWREGDRAALNVLEKRQSPWACENQKHDFLVIQPIIYSLLWLHRLQMSHNIYKSCLLHVLTCRSPKFISGWEQGGVVGSYEHSNGPFLWNTGNSQTSWRPVSFSGRICSMELVHRFIFIIGQLFHWMWDEWTDFSFHFHICTRVK